MSLDAPAGVAVLTRHSGSVPDAADRVLTHDALAFVAELERRFGPRRRELLERRRARQRDLDAGAIPGFLVETRSVREAEWRVAPTPPALERRRVEITGPVDRKMMINALNSGADVFMADFEDALSPTWENVVDGQANVQDAVRGTLSFTGPDGRDYRLADERATLLIRPRGWHLVEAHVHVDGAPVSASLFDFGLVCYHNAAEQLARGAGPFFYLPKLESHLEARLWNDVFTAAEQWLGIPHGSARATVLIETVLAAFEMDEILYELRDHAAGLNAGRWDYIFSVIKKFSGRADMVLPDRAQVTMAVPFMRAYTEQLVRVCHRRGAHAIGGMAAFVPNRRDPAVTEAAVAKVREDKLREAGAGFDGTWVAHPDLVPVAMAVFHARLGDRPNQKDVQRDDVRPDAGALLRLDIADGRVTDAGVRTNVDVALLYLDAWLRGSGAVAIHNLMEDAATAEISRAQLWQWIRHRVTTAEGRALTAEYYAAVRDDVLATLERERGDAPSRLRDAAELLDRLVLGESFVEFLTLVAYPMLDPDVEPSVEAESAPAAAPRQLPNDAGSDTAPSDEMRALAARWLAAGDAVARGYSPDVVVRLRGSVRESLPHARAGAERLRELLATRPAVHALGADDGEQAAEMVAAGIEALHASGPPSLVRAINDAMRRADRDAAVGDVGDEPSRRWIVPVIAAIDAPLDDPARVFDTASALIEAGAAALEVADRRASSVETLVGALDAARLAADVVDVPTVLVVRTDAARVAACARRADVLCLAPPAPDIGVVRAFADAARSHAPAKPLAFASDADTAWPPNLDPRSVDAFERELSKLGYRLQLVPHAGRQVARLATHALARDVSARGMLGYVDFLARGLPRRGGDGAHAELVRDAVSGARGA